MERKRLFIFLTIISIVMLGIGGTFAYYTTSAVATNITQIKSGNLTMTIDGGGDTDTSFMPSKCTSEYAIKKKIVATSNNTSGGKVSFSIGMNIATLSDSLKTSTMKFALTTSSDSCTSGLIANGNFSNATVGSDIWIVKNDYDNITQTDNSYTKTYYLYIWLDEEETQNLSGSISVNMKGTSSNNPSLTTETGGVKLIYDGVPSNGQCSNTGSNSTIGNSAFNSIYNDAKYVGYKYGSSIDDETYTDDSIIKAKIDDWYETNMTSYTSQLEDTVFCNDRSYTKDGVITNFGAYTRLDTNKTPTLKCQNMRDKFTTKAINGNGALEYPVGLITADEMAYAGGKYYSSSSDANRSFYLYTGRDYWVLSPYSFRNSNANEFNLNSDGNLNNNNVNNSNGVRPYF